METEPGPWSSGSGRSVNERGHAEMGIRHWALGAKNLAMGNWHAYCLLPLAFCLTFSASGCTLARVTVNMPLHEEDVAFIVPGQTSFYHVIDRIGVPDSIAPSENGMVATYYFLDAKYSRVNFGIIAKIWSPVDPDLIFAAGGLGADMFQVQFDGNGKALASSFAYHTYSRGFSAWPFSSGNSKSASPQDEQKEKQQKED